ncbi:hypothetical protein M422DRAFT_40759 [Sphaerobolus stellatus SS14]|nr:hypothetical protein M422DRAFT_40759 [Sphaerobolus stellatus SS14]
MSGYKSSVIERGIFVRIIEEIAHSTAGLNFYAYLSLHGGHAACRHNAIPKYGYTLSMDAYRAVSTTARIVLQLAIFLTPLALPSSTPRMKTVRTRVKSAFKRNSRGGTVAPSAPVTLPAASTSAPSILLPEKRGTTSEKGSRNYNEKDQQYSGFRFSAEPVSDSPLTTKDAQLPVEPPAGLTFTGEDPEHIYSTPQTVPIMIIDDSRRSTPRRRAKSVPRVSTDDCFPSPSIASRILTTLPPEEEEVKIYSPVDVNYMMDENQGSDQSLLQQPQPTDSSFVEITPKDLPHSLPPLNELLAQHAELKRLSSRIEMPVPQPEPGPSQLRIDEEKPLLQGDSSLLTAEVDEILDSVWPMPPRTFSSLGWTEHVLPSSAYYYSHAETRTVTDIDLRNERKLTAVTNYLKEKRSPRPSRRSSNLHMKDEEVIRSIRTFEVELPVEEGVDLWLRDVNATSSKGKNEPDWDFKPMKNWVLHASRAVTFNPPSAKDPAPEELPDEDRLDMESRYWQYMSTHPAHVTLPQAAYDEALEVLTWSYTDRVLKLSEPLPMPLPFTRKECEDILMLLRNIAVSSTPTTSQVVRTRLIAQVLLRYTEWRQKYLPKPNTNFEQSEKRTENTKKALPFRRTIMRFIKIIVLLGIPYLFERGFQQQRTSIDEEQVELNSSRAETQPLGHNDALIAGLLLTADVMMLALPDLNITTRILAVISALCAVSSLATHFFVFSRRYRGKYLQGNDGALQAIYRSLPVVFLVYAVCGFLVGVLAYAIGGTVGDQSSNFGKFTGWVILAIWLALVAVLVASTALAKLIS